MRAYQFLNLVDAKDDIAQQRLKISRLSDLNDPFEMLAPDLRDKSLRRVFEGLREQLSKNRGVLCFSRGWHNPVLWSHYADRHRGICLGFEIPEELATPIKYDGRRLVDVIPKLLSGSQPHREAAMKRVLTTKYRDWKYEREIRVFANLETVDASTGYYFADFGPALLLKEVILGPRFTGSVSDLVNLVRLRHSGVTVIPSRLAFKSFQVVPKKGMSVVV